jgi:hypothetical protein
VPYDLSGRDATETIRFRVIVNDVDDTTPPLTECRDGNNIAETSASCTLII